MSDSSQAEILVRVSDVHLQFATRRVLRGVNFSVARGQVQVILGMSGSGKTTLLRMLAGSLSPDQGGIEVFGADLASLNRVQRSAYRQRMGMIFQYSALLGSLDIFDNVALPLVEGRGWRRADCEQRVRRALEQVFLPVDEILHLMPANLSGGMRKRVGIARALVQEPELLLYDEPTSGLDAVTARGIDDLVLRLKAEHQVTSIIITHDIAGAMRIADNIAILHAGSIVASGSPQQLAESQHPVVVQLLSGSVHGPLTDAPAEPVSEESET